MALVVSRSLSVWCPGRKCASKYSFAIATAIARRHRLGFAHCRLAQRDPGLIFERHHELDAVQQGQTELVQRRVRRHDPVLHIFRNQPFHVSSGRPFSAAARRPAFLDPAPNLKCDDAVHKIRRGRRIHGNDRDSNQHTSPECRDPLGAAVTPNQQAIPGRQPGLRQSTGKPLRGRAQLVVRIRPSPESVVVDERLRAAPDIAIEEVEQVLHDRVFSAPNVRPRCLKREQPLCPRVWCRFPGSRVRLLARI